MADQRASESCTGAPVGIRGLVVMNGGRLEPEGEPGVASSDMGLPAQAVSAKARAAADAATM
ncbi:hypothetical protein MSA03_07140 [Microbacterium saccharophilum]|nr:hypothetical protein MSA03_07140 [Microbacterium saccharophilum]